MYTNNYFRIEARSSIGRILVVVLIKPQRNPDLCNCIHFHVFCSEICVTKSAILTVFAVFSNKIFEWANAVVILCFVDRVTSSTVSARARHARCLRKYYYVSDDKHICRQLKSKNHCDGLLICLVSQC